MTYDIIDVAYVCDRKAPCQDRDACGTTCFHTFDIEHAANFHYIGGSQTVTGYAVYEEKMTKKENNND